MIWQSNGELPADADYVASVDRDMNRAGLCPLGWTLCERWPDQHRQLPHEDVDQELREAIEQITGKDLVDDYGGVADAVLLCFREDDGDLTDILVDALAGLTADGAIWLLVTKSGNPASSTPPTSVRLVLAPETEPGAFPITAMRHPAAPGTVVGLPNPDHGVVPATWAP
ncbi:MULTISPECIES: DUF3052 family protein [Streptomyces]|uniref:DUF3052 family protein n=1 Tax=Streptomyces TaxID=1883 RepID=UPI00287F82B8|nr:DUF3052 family protein [Streptomyces sp. CGMCC 4.1456]WNF66515.1 DUF3052 family protein [Streptomyces sp. CGMCC 4.1456]